MPLPRDPFWDVDIPRGPSIINEFIKQMARLTDAEIMRDGYKLERAEAAKLFLKARDRAMKAERERDEACSRHVKAERTIKVLRESRAHWRASFERVLGQRDRLAANSQCDLCKDDAEYHLCQEHMNECVIGERDLKAENAVLTAALRKIKTLPFKTTERVFEVIDAALDGVE